MTDSSSPDTTASSCPDTVFVFVHGAWHGSGQWAATQRALAGLGAASMAVDLPGHGFDAPLPSGYLTPGQPGLLTEKSALATVTMDDCAAAVLDTLRQARHHRRVVLVAHSAGGGPASLAAERAPELVDEIVYLSAFVPAGRPRFFDYLGSPENATARGQSLNLGDPGELGAVRINPLSQDPAYVEELRQTHYHDTPLDRFDRWRSALSPDLPLAIPTTPVIVTPGRWGRVPRTFLRCADDRALPTAVQDLMIAEADRAVPGNPFTVRTLPGSHSPFAARPHELAAALLP
ncbi:alpha/beta hydrolase [Streptomyces sp. NPDC047197]|uniref:alpha/beta hydrolase n=1 Tax=Streptomyces sp. NPDC047197 TaxID=3155477 RepID=UPI0033E99F62